MISRDAELCMDRIMGVRDADPSADFVGSGMPYRIVNDNVVDGRYILISLWRVNVAQLVNSCTICAE